MIPVNQPLITKQDAIAVYKSVKSGWVSSVGPQIKIFENKFKKMKQSPVKTRNAL